MPKRNYTHIKELLPTIEAMVAEGMTQREIAEHFGFKDKSVVKLMHLCYSICISKLENQINFGDANVNSNFSSNCCKIEM